MFYETEKNNHGLPFNPFKACVVPRPIGWITSINLQGQINLAPYSFFNAVADVPPVIIFSTTGPHSEGGDKDTLANVETTKEFVVNIATWELSNAVNLTSGDFGHGINEIEVAALETLPSTLVKPPRLKKSPIHLECLYHQSVQLPTINDQQVNRLVIAKVIGIHISDEVIVDGKVDITRFQPLARLGYWEYTAVTTKFEMRRPIVKNNGVTA